jgi:hypothetical protein
MKEYLVPFIIVIVALLAYDLLIKKFVLKSSFEEEFEEVE